MKAWFQPYSPPLDKMKLSRMRPAVDRPAPAKSSFGREPAEDAERGRYGHGDEEDVAPAERGCQEAAKNKPDAEAHGPGHAEDGDGHGAVPSHEVVTDDANGRGHRGRRTYSLQGTEHGQLDVRRGEAIGQRP